MTRKKEIEDLVRAELAKAFKAQRRQTGGAHPNNGNGASTAMAPQTERQVKIEDVATIDDLARAGAQVQWLWPGWLPNGVLTAMAAEGGVGKTRFCADLLRRITHGLPWPDGRPMTMAPEVLGLWVVADNHHDEMVTLARDFDISPAIRVNALKADPFGGVSLETSDDLLAFESILAAVKPAFAVIDTVGNATDKNLSKQEEAKAFYWPLQVFARRHRTAILCLTHLNTDGKFLGRRVLEKVRVAIRIEKPDPENDKRRLEVVKTNSRKPKALGLTMGDSGNEYDDQPPVSPEGPESGQTSGRDAPKLQEAIDWLLGYLGDTPKKVVRIRTAADSAGISVNTLYRAKEALGIEEFVSENLKWWKVAHSSPF